MVFASYYTAIFGSLMSESKTSYGERWMSGLPSVMLYTQAERARVLYLVRSVFSPFLTAVLLVRTPLFRASGGWGKAYETHIAS